MFAAQEALSKVAVVQDRVRLAKDRLDREQNAEEQPNNSLFHSQPEAKPDPKAEDWANKNTWFGSDEVMTYAAFGIHKKLVEEEGFDPNTDEYYTEVDKRIRSEFPQNSKRRRNRVEHRSHLLPLQQPAVQQNRGAGR